MELTKEECVQYHRELWDWLSKNPEKNKDDWPGWDEVERKIGWGAVEDYNFCFCCLWGLNYYAEFTCENRLLDWPMRHDDGPCEIDEKSEGAGLFRLWEYSLNIQTRAKLAEQIRDLPVREDA